MKNIFLISLTYLVLSAVNGQVKTNFTEGKVTFKSNKNVYVKFYSTENMRAKDTLYYVGVDGLVPSLIIKHLSTTSCVSENFTTHIFTEGETIKFKNTAKENEIEVQTIQTPIIKTIVTNSQESIDSTDRDTTSNNKRLQKINGRLSMSSNGSITDGNSQNFQRIRVALSMNIQNIHSSALSLQSYITYRHRYGIDQSQVGFYDDFKIYALNLLYAPTEKYNVSLGRKINNKIANMGAIDGIQGELNFGTYSAGIFAGTRPDISNYKFNARLTQFGGFIARNDKTKNGIATSSLAFGEQQNDFKTDRRFMYFQHNNSMFKNLNVFISAEMDMYQKIGDISTNHLKITSTYLSLRYRIRKNLSISSSYDNRRNVIFYESYQTYIDQLLAQETRQGLRFQVNYTAFKLINISVSNFLRYQGSNPIPTKNYVGNISVSRLPGTNISASFSANILESYYFKGNILGCRFNKTFMKGKLQAEINYRNLTYTFNNTESSLKQNIAGINLSINILKLTSLMLSYEGTFEPNKKYHRYFFTAVQRFKN